MKNEHKHKINRILCRNDKSCCRAVVTRASTAGTGAACRLNQADIHEHIHRRGQGGRRVNLPVIIPFVATVINVTTLPGACQH